MYIHIFITFMFMYNEVVRYMNHHNLWMICNYEPSQFTTLGLYVHVYICVMLQRDSYPFITKEIDNSNPWKKYIKLSNKKKHQ